jgi:hypothetical protein
MAAPDAYRLEIGEDAYELKEAEFGGILYEIAINLVFHKLVDRATYVLCAPEAELTGSGSGHFDVLSVSLYRHLKENRGHGPEYEGLGGNPQSFRIHSVKDALVTVAFFLHGGDCVPHFILGRPDRDMLIAQDRGRRTQLNVEDRKLIEKFSRLARQR